MIHLSSPLPENTQNKPRSLLNLKPRKAIPFPVDSTSTFTIVPKALKEDKVCYLKFSSKLVKFFGSFYLGKLQSKMNIIQLHLQIMHLLNLNGKFNVIA